MFLYETKFGDNPTFAPDYADTIATENSRRAAADALWQTTKDLADYRDNSNGEQAAKGEAYERRNKAIFDATGVQLDNPMKFDVFKLKPEPGAAGLPEPSARGDIAAQEQAWYDKASALARDKPEFANVIGIDRPVIEDAYAITRGAEKAAASAEQQADASGLSGVRRLGASLGGGLAGALRDPLQVATLAAGGGMSSPARALGWRLLESVFTEGAINGGIEAGVQLSSNDWKKRAGVDASLSTSLKQVGLAALFGGGFGGLLEGGRTVAHLLGAEVPEEVLTRAASGNPEPGDFSTIADAMGVKVDPATVRAADLAAEQPALDAAAFGPPPEGLGDDEAAGMAAQALRAVDSPDDVRAATPVVRPAGPASLPIASLNRSTDRLSLAKNDIAKGNPSKTSGPIEVSIGPDGVPLVTDGYHRLVEAEAAGKTDIGVKYVPWLDTYGRVIKNEQGRFLPGEPLRRENATAAETLAAAGFDLNRLSSEGHDVAAIMQAAPVAEAGRALQNQEIRGIEDNIAELSALEPVQNAHGPGLLRTDKAGPQDQVFEFGMGEPLTKPELAAQIKAQKGRLAELKGLAAKGEAHPDFIQQMEFSRRAVDSPLLPAGATPEPATPQAGELATLALTEARRPSVGEAKPVNLDSGKKLSVWDAMPAAKDADGTIQHATHETMIADADRTEFFGDLIASCKD